MLETCLTLNLQLNMLLLASGIQITFNSFVDSIAVLTKKIVTIPSSSYTAPYTSKIPNIRYSRWLKTSLLGAPKKKELSVVRSYLEVVVLRYKKMRSSCK